MSFLCTSQAARRKEIEAAEKGLLRCETEELAFQHLFKTKPSYLRCGGIQNDWVDSKTIKEDLRKMCTKLRIHGYDDRAERFQYLYSILEGRWEAKPSIFKNIMRFMLEMSQRPTEVLNLTLQDDVYSKEPEQVEPEEVESSEQLKEIEAIVRELQEDHINVSAYSSGDDLSDWHLSDCEEYTKSVPIEKSKSKVRQSLTFSNFGEIDKKKAKESQAAEEAKQAFEAFWLQQERAAGSCLNTNVRRLNSITLTYQPVISSLVALHSKFGEFWEWRKRSLSSVKPHLPEQLILEDDAVIELLWQFANPSSSNSFLFDSNWQPKELQMLSSVSRLSFHSLIRRVYGNILKKLELLKNFLNAVDNNICPPKLYALYAQTLSEVLMYISRCADKIRTNRKTGGSAKVLKDEPKPHPCTTLIQLRNQLQEVFEIISATENCHIDGTTEIESETFTYQPWFCSIKLMSSLEVHLNVETRPSMYGLTLFLFSKCLLGFLNDLFTPLETLVWIENNYMFKKDPTVTLNHPNFWDTSITCQPIMENLMKSRGQNLPFSCLRYLLPKMLSMLKVLEMLRLLGGDFRAVLTGNTLSPRKIVEEFLNLLLNAEAQDIHTDEQERATNRSIPMDLLPDYETHFTYLGLGNAFETGVFKYVLEKEMISPTKIAHAQPLRLERFLRLDYMPITTPARVLDDVLVRNLDPYFKMSEESLKKIFREQHVNETVQLLGEIVLGAREDFVKDVSKFAVDENKPIPIKLRDANYQILLQKYYPEGRENFEIKLVECSKNSLFGLHFTLEVTPLFPLNLVTSTKTIDAYLFVARQLQRIRTSLWALNSIRMKDCKVKETTELNRVLLLRFNLIHFCSSLRTFLLLKIFSKDLSVSDSSNEYESLDCLLKAHEDFLCGLEGEVLLNRALDTVVIQNAVQLSSSLCKHWATGLNLMHILKMENTLKKCWAFLSFSAKNSREYNELAYHVGPPPTYL